MSVVDVTRMWSKTGASYSNDALYLVDTNYTLKDGYQVVCTPDTEPPEILAAGEIPKPSDRHPSGVDAFVKSRSCERVSPIMYMVDIEYEGYTFDPSTIEVSWSDTESSEPIDRDYFGNAIVTVNGEQVQGLTMQLADPIVTIKRQFGFINTFAVGPYRHATNSDTFLGWPAGTARLVGYQADNKYQFGGAAQLWDVTARIQFRYPLMGATAEQAWYKRWRHEGLYVRDPKLNEDNEIVGYFKPRRAKDVNGIEVSTPVLLKADGQQELNPDAAVFIYTRIYNSLPFSVLGLLG